jgi:hypothetical protein
VEEDWETWVEEWLEGLEGRQWVAGGRLGPLWIDCAELVWAVLWPNEKVLGRGSQGELGTTEVDQVQYHVPKARIELDERESGRATQGLGSSVVHMTVSMERVRVNVLKWLPVRGCAKKTNLGSRGCREEGEKGKNKIFEEGEGGKKREKKVERGEDDRLRGGFEVVREDMKEADQEETRSVARGGGLGTSKSTGAP